MSERKSINKYYPPDYNPLEAEHALHKASKALKTKNRDAITIRLMTPFSMRCLKCSEYIAKSRKFNGKKEALKEKYLDTIKVYRFSIKCPRCNNMICFRTDPKSADYVVETGGKRNYEPAKSGGEGGKLENVQEAVERLVEEQKRAEVGGDADDRMEVLEGRLLKLEKQREADQELEEIKRRGSLRRHHESRLQRDDNDVDDDGDLDELAERAFAARQSLQREPAPSLTATLGRTAAARVAKPKKKKNPLGVTVKRK